jgi:uncharacterized protein YfaS (alpha-2-macroglobulin family)
MRALASLFLITMLLALPALAEPAQFQHHGLAKDAERYEAYIETTWQAGNKRPKELKTAAERSLGIDPRAASRNYAAAVAADKRDAEAWMGLARSLLAIAPDPKKGSERFDLPVNASAAAYIAYERAKDNGAKAAALRVLGQALVRRSYWRPAIDALKTSLTLAFDQATDKTYQTLRTEHGFRMVDYKTDSEAASPRVCLQFSERLSRAQSDFAKFISVDGKDPQGVSPEEKQLCIDGLAHGQRYEITLRAGLPSDVGEVLEKPSDVGIYVPDRKPFVRFTGKSYVLPSRGQQGIPVVSVNTRRVGIEVYRVGDRNLSGVLANEFQRQMSSYDTEALKERTGERVYKGEMDISPKLNEEVTTAFPVSEAIGQLKPGAYAMVAKPAEGKSGEGNELATQWFVVSDLGLTALTGSDGMNVFVRSLATTDAIAGAEVRLVAKNNEVLAKLKSDDKGYVHFDAGLTRGEGGLQPAVLVAEKGAGEYAFLDLATTAFDLSDRGVKGRESPGPVDAYVYAERGVYRPGEDVYLTGLVRDAKGLAASLPVTLIVSRPDGVEYKRFAVNDMGLGGRAATLHLSGSAQTGTWRVKLHTDPKAEAIAQTAFMVEDFVPERLEMTLTPAAGALKPEKPLEVTLDGRYLYGPPAANLAVEGDIVVKSSARDIEGFAGYRFGQSDEKFTTIRKPLEGLPATGADGKAVLAIPLPAVPKTAKSLEADLLIRLREPGGRTLERTVTVPVDLALPRLGIKPLFTQLNEDETATFDVIALDEASKRVVAKGVRWELSRLDTTWQWYNHSGNWQFEAQTITRKIANGTADLTAEAPARIAAKIHYGRYRLDIASADPDGPAASYIFHTGWYSANSENSDTPETLEMALDKASYKAGDTAKVRIATKLGGKAMIAVLGNGLLKSETVDVPKGGGEFPISVGADWGPGAYVTTMLYRPMDEAAKRMPSRAIGITWLSLDQSSRTLKVALDTPAKIKSDEGLVVPVKVGGLNPGEEARLTVAAVDLGILNLTRYQPPAPENWFNAQRLLGVEIRDFYGKLIDGMHADRGKLRSGGDGPGGGGLSMDGSPPVEATVSLYSGIVTVGADGTAKAEFKLPDFNGTVRVMAVAWSRDKVGHASRDVIVRDAVALTVSGPRFLTLGDEAQVDLSVHNVDGPEATYAVAVVQQATQEGAAGPTSRPVATRNVELKATQRKAERIAVKPTEVGRAEYDVAVSGPGGISVKRHLSFDVKPPAGDIRRTTVSQLAPKGGKLTLSSDLVSDLIASRTRITMSVGPAALLDVPGVLAALDRYPYGCAEQTVSRAMPLVYANAIASQIGLGLDKAIRERVQGAIDRVFEMQDSSGAFGVWGPSNADMWLTSYVVDFLTRAKEAGYQVRPQAFTQAVDRLSNYVSYAQDFERGGETRAYALYVLARNGRAPIGELRYYVDTRLDRFTTPLAKAQLGAALAMMGDKERSERAFKDALDGFDVAAKDVARSDFGSNLRDGAALVTLAAETGVARSEQPKLVSVIAKAFHSRRYTSTQEQAWLVLAANALADQAKAAKLTVNGQSIPGSINRSLSAAELKDGNLVVTNEGDAATDAVISVIGAALTPEPPIAKGFRIERSYYTLEGAKVDLPSATGGVSELKQNDRLVVVVKVDAKEAGGRVLLVDRLPAGLEIENPRLVDGGDIKTLDWLKSALKPEHTEFRDDRFVAAFNLSSGLKAAEGEDADPEAEMKPDSPAASTATVAYIVRAVTPGSFVHPAATVEDMYRPERYARTAAGRLTVSAK